MRIEIDQSGKIENTNRPTIIAYSNKNNDVLLISAKDKKEIQKYFRNLGKPKLFIYLTFIVIVSYLIKDHIKNGDQIIIDREYPGYEKLISKKVKEIIVENSNTKDISVYISQIGKKSNAHDLAWKELQSKTHKNIRKITSALVIKIIKTKLKSGSI